MKSKIITSVRLSVSDNEQQKNNFRLVGKTIAILLCLLSFPVLFSCKEEKKKIHFKLPMLFQ